MLKGIYALVMYSAVLSNSSEKGKPLDYPEPTPISIEHKLFIKEEELRVEYSPRQVSPKHNLPRINLNQRLSCSSNPLPIVHRKHNYSRGK